MANWFGSNLVRHYQRELLCKRHRKYNIIVTHSQTIMFTYSVALKVASFQSPKKALDGDVFAIFSKLFDQKCWDFLYQHKHPK